MKPISPLIVRQLFVLLLILLTGGLIMKEMMPYLGGILGAITMYVLLKKPLAYLLKHKWNEHLAAFFLMAMSFFAILIPLVGLGLLMGSKVEQAVKNSEAVVKVIKEQMTQLEDYLGIEVASQLDSSGIASSLSKNLQDLVGGTFNTILSVTILYFLLYFMLVNTERMKASLFEYIPIRDGNLKTIGTETTEKVKANALGIPLVALGQGIVGLIGFLIFGIPDPFFWAAVVTIGSMVPFVGSALGTVPVFLLSLSNGHPFQAWGILIYGLVAIGATDNVFRLYILKRLDDVHPLITLIGVLVGVPLFGFIGLIFGPLLVSLFLVVLKIYKNEYGQEEEKV